MTAAEGRGGPRLWHSGWPCDNRADKVTRRLPEAKSRLPEERNSPMADHTVPHFHNDIGVPIVQIGAHEFMCIGARPPFDHPHVFLDMGDDVEIICPYCSTLYRHRKGFAATETEPAGCLWQEPALV
jgi:uncharacterized Zn-finger protein